MPQGDVGGLRDMAQTFDGLSGALERSGAQFGVLPSELSSWQGGASVSFASTALQSRAVADQAGRGFSLKAQATRALADELEEAQRDTRAAIEDARDAERRIDRAKELVEEAQQRLEAARAKAALAEIEIFATGLAGPPSSGALAARDQAQEEIQRATDDIERGRKLLEQARDDLERARQRGNRAEQRAEDAGVKAQGLFASATPAPALPLLGGPALVRLGAQPVAPLHKFSPLLTFDRLGAQPFPPLQNFSPLLPMPLLALGPDGASKLLQGASGGLGSYGTAAAQRNRMLRSFHARGLGSLGDPEFSRYLLSPEARAQQGRMHRYHSDELDKAKSAGDDISKAKTAGRFLGPAGDVLGAKANADEGMPWLENALRTGGSWGGGAAGAGLAGTACAPGGPVAAGACGTGGAIGGGELGDWLGGKTYEGLDWTYQNGIEPAGKKIGEGLEYGYDKTLGKIIP